MPLFLTFKLIAPHWFVRIFLCFFFDKIIHVNATFVGSCQFSAFIMIHIIKLNTHSASCSVRLDVSMLFFSPPLPPSILQRLRPPGRSYCLHSCNNSVANIVKKLQNNHQVASQENIIICAEINAISWDNRQIEKIHVLPCAFTFVKFDVDNFFLPT